MDSEQENDAIFRFCAIIIQLNICDGPVVFPSGHAECYTAAAEIDVKGDCLHGYIRKIGEVIVQGYD